MFSKIFNKKGASADQAVVANENKNTTPDMTDLERTKTWDGEAAVATEKDYGVIDSQPISEDAQDGVKKIEAITSVWSKKALVTAYILIFCINFIDAMQQGTTGLLGAYVTSEFYLHSLTAATGVASGIIGGLTKLPLAKVIDIFGRPQGFAVMVGFQTLGLIMMAACNGVQTYAAAQVFYWVGYNGMSYVLGIFVADTSSLRNRGFMFAFTSSPYIATVWITGPLAQAFMSGPGWRWAFGTFAIITPVICAPLYILFSYNYRKAEKAGLIVARPKSGRTFMQSVKYYAIEFDIIGLLLITAGLALFLLPFSLYSYQGDGWRSALVISMITIGGILCILFVLYEKFLAPVTFIPYELLLDRTVIGACILAATLFVEFYIWNSYFYSFLQVVNGLNLTKTGYITNIYSIGSCFWSFIIGLWIRYTGKFKAAALYFGVPITILGIALMIHFRQPDVNIGYIIMCQIFIAFGGGTLVITEQIAVMAATSHQYVAVVLAIEGMFSSVGGAIGSSIASAIWTGVFPARLRRYLPEETNADWASFYGDIVKQMSYPQGSPTRIAVNRAYGDAQRYMLIGSTAVLALAILGVFMWRDINVKHFKQTKGTVA